jgi:hypothetical protein
MALMMVYPFPSNRPTTRSRESSGRAKGPGSAQSLTDQVVALRDDPCFVSASPDALQFKLVGPAQCEKQ